MSKLSGSNVREVINKYMLADGMDPVIDLDKSHGVWLVDSKDDKEYLVFGSFLVVEKFLSMIGFNEK